MGEDLYTMEEDFRSTWMLLSIGFQLRNLVLTLSLIIRGLLQVQQGGFMEKAYVSFGRV
jgi:hypothetical protein